MIYIKNVVLRSIQRLAFWRAVRVWWQTKKEQEKRVLVLRSELAELGVRTGECDAIYNRDGIVALESALVETRSRKWLEQRASEDGLGLLPMLRRVLALGIAHKDANALLSHARDFMATAKSYSDSLQTQVRKHLNALEWFQASYIIGQASRQVRFRQIQKYLWELYDDLPTHRQGDLASRIESCLAAYGAGDGRFENEYSALLQALSDAEEVTDKFGFVPPTQ